MSVTGVEGEERGDYSREESRLIRARSLRLLGSLLRPVRGRVILTLLVVIVSTAAQVAGPALIAAGINQGLPAALDGDFVPLGLAVGGYLVTGILGAVLIAWYTMLSARVSQQILFDLRRPVGDTQTRRPASRASHRKKSINRSERGAVTRRTGA